MRKSLSLFKALFKKEAPTFDPSRIGDPLALRIEWTPANRGGASFRTHTLVRVDTLRREFRASTPAKLFYCSFIGIGAVVFGFACAALPREGSGSFSGLWAPLLLGIIFSVAGGFMLRRGTVPIVFDKCRGFFWKGKIPPYEIGGDGKGTTSVRLEDVYAIQLLSEYCCGNESRFYSYELNLVLKDGGRMNVIDHGNRAVLREQARELSLFLGKPVWDAIGP